MQAWVICPSVKHLDLSGVTFLNLDHLLLGSLLERLTATLRTLQLKGCMIMDFQISALLPALSQCTQLTEVNFLKNFLSVASIRKLLQHTAKLTLLTRELYPAPIEVYDDFGYVHPDRFIQHCGELMQTLRTIRQQKVVCFVSNRCLDCRDLSVYNMETTLCSCWQWMRRDHCWALRNESLDSKDSLETQNLDSSIFGCTSERRLLY